MSTTPVLFQYVIPVFQLSKKVTHSEITQLSSNHSNLGTRWPSVASVRPRPFYPLERNTVSIAEKAGCTQVRSVQLGRKYVPLLPEFETRSD